jgi:hypothetical protein
MGEHGTRAAHILVAVARYLAADSLTERGWLQTTDIAARLSKGEQLHADEPPARPWRDASIEAGSYRSHWSSLARRPQFRGSWFPVAFGGEPIIARPYIVTKEFTVNEGEKGECDIFVHRSFTVFNATQIEELSKAERPTVRR